MITEPFDLDDTHGQYLEARTESLGMPLQREQAAAGAHGSRLLDALQRMDRAHCGRRSRSREDASALWQALLAGQFGVLEAFDRDGRRYILAVRHRSRRRVLTPRESAVVRAAARGLANKAIGSELGMATGTVGVHLASALRKLGLPNRCALIQLLPGLERSGLDRGGVERSSSQGESRRTSTRSNRAKRFDYVADG